jgi:hypothetical protein
MNIEESKQLSEIQRKFQELIHEPIDYTNLPQLAEDVWLFISGDKDAKKKTVTKEVVIHEVTVMLQLLQGFHESKCGEAPSLLKEVEELRAALNNAIELLETGTTKRKGFTYKKGLNENTFINELKKV